MIELALGVIGIVLAIIGWILEPAVFPHAWLSAVALWMGWPLGSLGLILVHSLTGGRWGELMRPQLMAGVTTLPLLIPALIPIFVRLPALYPWADPGLALDNRFYLNLPFFAARILIDLVVWNGLALIVVGRLRQGLPLAPIAPWGLIALALTYNFAAIDLTLSLQPKFASSVYGMMAIVEALLLALSVASLLRVLAGLPNADSLARMLIALTILWAYLDFMQLLIVWQSNLPSEAPYFLPRLYGSWGIAAAMVAILHFVLPFLALLSPSLRASPRGVGTVAVLLIAGEIIRGWWLVIPAAHRGLGWVDVAAMAGVWGIAAALAGRVWPVLRERRHA